MKKTTQLRQMLNSPELEFLMEAHNGMSAKIVEDAGFKGIWASGLTISASMGVRDNNEVSWTQVIDIIEFMSDATRIPILLDGDTGYGNFNNMRRLVQKLEQRNIAGVCIEDKVFPKTNSFLRGETQPLADIEEFCGKIKAAKDIQSDDDFVVAARVEAFIAGWGITEALKRAEAYRRAGADALLIHSRLPNASEVFDFKKEWGDRSPVIIVPTTYYTTPTEEFQRRHFSLVIWANQMFRGAVKRMQEIADKIYSDQNLRGIEETIASVKTIFELQNDQELLEAEELYLAKKSSSQSQAIILAATQGKQLGNLTHEIPKTMLKIGRQSILERIVHHLKEHRINTIHVVTGYHHETVTLPNLNKLHNCDFETSGQIRSLALASEYLTKETFVIFGDILFRHYMLQLALNDPGDVVLVVDTQFDVERDYRSDFVTIQETSPSSAYLDEVIEAKELVFGPPQKHYFGEWIGLLKLSEKGAFRAQTYIREQQNRPGFDQLDIKDMVNSLIQGGLSVHIQQVSGHWVDVNQIEDLTTANEF